MLLARSRKHRYRGAIGMKNQHLAGGQVVVGKIHQTALLVAAPLPLMIPFHLLKMGLAVLLPVVGMRLTPLARTLQADLPVNRVGSDLLPMIFPPALTLARKLAANLLLGMVRGWLKNLLAITATTQTHRGGSGSEWDSLILSGSLAQLESTDQKFSLYRISCRVFAASSRMGLLLIKPAELLLFYSGADTGLPGARHQALCHPTPLPQAQRSGRACPSHPY